MKFRVPEILTGTLLAVAIFALGATFSNVGQKDQHLAARKSEAHGGTKLPDAELAGTTWLTKDASGFFAFIAATIAVGQALLFLYQLRLMNRGMGHTETAAQAAVRAADGTTAAVDLAKANARHEMRAYVMLETARIVGLEVGSTPVAHLTFKNFGQTPAIDATIWCVLGFDRYPLDESHIPAQSDQHFPQPMAPGNTYETSCTNEQEVMDIKKLSALSGGDYAVYAIGMFQYKDVFGVSHETRFILFNGGAKRLKDNTLSPYLTGNHIT